MPAPYHSRKPDGASPLTETVAILNNACSPRADAPHNVHMMFEQETPRSPQAVNDKISGNTQRHWRLNDGKDADFSRVQLNADTLSHVQELGQKERPNATASNRPKISLLEKSKAQDLQSWADPIKHLSKEDELEWLIESDFFNIEKILIESMLKEKSEARKRHTKPTFHLETCWEKECSEEPVHHFDPHHLDIAVEEVNQEAQEAEFMGQLVRGEVDWQKDSVCNCLCDTVEALESTTPRNRMMSLALTDKGGDSSCRKEGGLKELESGVLEMESDKAREIESTSEYTINQEGAEDPHFPPGFEPGQWTGTSQHDGNSPTFRIEATASLEGQYGTELQLLNAQAFGKNMRHTRSFTRRKTSVKSLQQTSEAVETWELGKKFGLSADDEEAVIKELAKDHSAPDLTRQRKRGRPRKLKA